MIDTGVASGVAVVVSAGSLAVHRVSSLIAHTDVDGITPFVDGGTAALHSGVFLYLVHQFLSGKLLSVNTNRREERLAEAVRELTEMVRQSHAREERLTALLTQRLNPGDLT